MSGLVPTALGLALALGSPVSDEKLPPDYQLDVRLTAPSWSAGIYRARAAGQTGFGHDLTLGRDIASAWQFGYEERARAQRHINRQRLTVQRRIWLGSAGGVGVTTRRYRQPTGAVSLALPLPGGGISYLTDFRRVHVTEVEAYLRLPLSEAVEPFVQLYYLRDRVSDWRLGVGMQIKMQDEK